MTEKIDWYKVCVLSWAKKNQHIRWQDDGEAQDKTGQRQAVGSVVPRDEARRVPRFMVTRRSNNGY